MVALTVNFWKSKNISVESISVLVESFNFCVESGLTTTKAAWILSILDLAEFTTEPLIISKLADFYRLVGIQCDGTYFK